MKKRLLSVLLAAAMTASLFAGCGNPENNGNEGTAGTSGTSGTENASGNAATAGGETEHIIMTYLTLGTTPPDLQIVQDAVNKISVPEINVEVEFKPISIPETFSGTYSMWIGSGEQIDLMCVAFQGLNDFVSSGQVSSLNELIAENGAYLSALSEEFPIYDGAAIDGEVYGVGPVMASYGMRGGMVLRKEYFEETGMEYKDQYTWEEMTEILGAVKEGHPDTYPCCVLGSGINNSQSGSGFFLESDALGATVKSGVLMSCESTEIVNLFETAEYYEYLLLMRDWYEKEYIMPDAATTDSSSTELLASGKCSGNPMNLQPVQIAGSMSAFGWESVGLNMTDGYYPAASPSGGTYWTVPVTSANPSAAIRFLNLIYANQAVADLLKNGIEGTHYVKTDKESVISFPDGVTMENTTYFMPLGLYGDRRYELQMSEGASLADNEAWTNQNMKKQYQSVGYSYNASNKTNELIAIATVLDQYLPSLETGSVSDVEGTYNDMIHALKAAGIEDVIADNQAQFDAWLAENK